MLVGGLDSTCGMKADPACQWLPTVMDHFPPVDGILKGIGLGLQRWEEDDERNTGHLGKKKKKSFINSVGKSERRVLSQTESLRASSSLGATVGQA